MMKTLRRLLFVLFWTLLLSLESGECRRRYELPLKENLVPSSYRKYYTQMELLHTLRADGMVDKVVLQRGDDILSPSQRFPRQSISPQPGEEQELAKDVLFEAIKSSEDTIPKLKLSEDRKAKKMFRSEITRERLLSLMKDVMKSSRSGDSTAPKDRDTYELADRVMKFPRKITLNDKFLPGISSPDGSKCIEKVYFLKETKFEHGMNCTHHLAKECHLTYITDYESAPQTKCETNYEKRCYIVFKPVPTTENVKICHVPYISDCRSGNDGPKICRKVQEDSCTTTYKEYELDQDEPKCESVEELRCKKEPFELLHLPHKDSRRRPYAQKERCEKWPVQKCHLEKKRVKKIHPTSECKKIPRTVCAPKNCKVVPGREICQEEKRTLVHNVPEEDCSIQPQEVCHVESTLVPRLVPKKNCIQFPKEICVNTKTNPKKVMIPILTKWCYKPSDLRDAINQE